MLHSLIQEKFGNWSYGGSEGKESTCNAGDLSLIWGLGRSPGRRHGNPLQYTCLENGQRSLMSYSPWNSSDQNTGVGSLSLLQGYLLNPGIEPRSSTLQVDSLLSEPLGKPWLSVMSPLFMSSSCERRPLLELFDIKIMFSRKSVDPASGTGYGIHFKEQKMASP